MTRVIKTATETYLKDFPYFSQLDNLRNSMGACNVTSLAMCLFWLAIRGDGSGQLEDQLYSYAEKNGISRHSPDGLKAIVEGYSKGTILDNLTIKGGLQDIRDSIDKGIPCVVHSFINSDVGHIFVISGYSEKYFLVNDPYGEWFPTGYDTRKSGKNLKYSNALIASACDSWSYSEFMRRYKAGDTSANSIYLHRIYQKS